jgi:hypothetical protein
VYFRAKKELKAKTRLLKRIQKFEKARPPAKSRPTIPNDDDEEEEEEEEEEDGEDDEDEGKDVKVKKSLLEIPTNAEERQRLKAEVQASSEKWQQVIEWVVRWPVAIYDYGMPPPHLQNFTC